MPKDEIQTTRPLTDEQWMYWQKLVSDEHDRKAAEIERLRGIIADIAKATDCGMYFTARAAALKEGSHAN